MNPRELVPKHTHKIFQISHFALHAHTLIMENTQRNAYDAAFKLMAIDLAVKEGNRPAARKLGINESMVRHWRWQATGGIFSQKKSYSSESNAASTVQGPTLCSTGPQNTLPPHILPSRSLCVCSSTDGVMHPSRVSLVTCLSERSII